jgi:hypothetical protein
MNCHFPSASGIENARKQPQQGWEQQVPREPASHADNNGAILRKSPPEPGELTIVADAEISALAAVTS